MPTPEENRAALENLLDNLTVNFFRIIKDQHNLWTPHGTALGISSISYGVYPTGEGAYQGYFGARTRKGTLLFYVENPIKVAGVTFLRQLENGRGHQVRYVKNYKSGNQDPLASGEKNEGELEEKVAGNDIPITDAMMPNLSKYLGALKRCEFLTCRKYRLQDKESNKEQHRSADFIVEQFDFALARAFRTSPKLPASLAVRTYFYTFKEQTPTDLVFKHIKEKGPDITLPLAQLSPEEAEALLKEKGMSLDFRYYLKPGTDGAVQTNWELFDINTGIFFGKSLLHRTPAFIQAAAA